MRTSLLLGVCLLLACPTRVSAQIPTITSPLSVSEDQNEWVSYQITATGSPTSYVALYLPAGLTANTTTGVISGYIGTTGIENCTIGATNASGTTEVTLTWNTTAASITCNGSISPNEVATSEIDPQPVTLTRNGSANFGIAWTESTIWLPSGSAEVVGDMPLGSTNYMPDGGPGVYSWQYRVVDEYYNYKDQWITFYVGSFSLLQVTTNAGLVYDGNSTNVTINFGQWITVNATAVDPGDAIVEACFAGDFGISTYWAAYGSINDVEPNRSPYSFSTTYQPSAVNSGDHWFAAFASNASTWWGTGFNLYVNQAMPNGSFSATTKNPTIGGYTLTSSDLSAVFSNPYSTSVVGPTGSVTYKISGTSTSLTAGSVIPSGATVIEADYSGDANYAATLVTATFTVLGPTPVAYLQGTANSMSVTLTWNASISGVGIKNYQIYRNNVLLATVTAPGYTDASPIPGTTYTYMVTATDNSGYVSEPGSVNITAPPDFELFTPIP